MIITKQKFLEVAQAEIRDCVGDEKRNDEVEIKSKRELETMLNTLYINMSTEIFGAGNFDKEVNVDNKAYKEAMLKSLPCAIKNYGPMGAMIDKAILSTHALIVWSELFDKE